MFDRIEKLIGKENLKLIKNKKVMLVGLGGVGGSALESLIRSGIENIVIIDFDVVEESNLNRQIISNTNNIGNKKTDVSEEFIKSINNKCKIKKYNLFLDESNISKIIKKEKPDYIIDACDSIKAKESIIIEAKHQNIKVISCMGTANKFNPSLLKITTIDKTKNDPLAKIIRKWARDNRITKLAVVSSTELPVKNNKALGTMCFVPNAAGILLANYVIMDILNKKL